MQKINFKPFCSSLLTRSRFITRVVPVGKVEIGGENPLRIQSMTTTDTMDTEGSIQQSIRMIEAGCEIVRLTAPSKKEAENLKEIKQGLINMGFEAPLVADIHFTPNAAEIAANHVEKVRVNPGNYADKKRFENIEYTDATYNDELIRIEEKFTPLVLLCKEKKVAMRIGTNHGSLSDRILSRYGDTPEGMVESAMEFLRICVKHDYHDVVLSMKASNTIVMVEAYRMLVATMLENDMNYPLHLGVTEAGDGEDGRIKSAVGIGTLLEDGIGDTIRVSLTEAPEAEIPVAKKLADKYLAVNRHDFSLAGKEFDLPLFDPFHYDRRDANEIEGIGHKHAPVVVADLSKIDTIKHSHFFGFGYVYSKELDKWNIKELAADIVYIGSNKIDFELPGTIKVACDADNWKENYQEKEGFYPLYKKNDLKISDNKEVLFLEHQAEDPDVAYLNQYENAILVLSTSYTNKTQLYRYFRLNLAKAGLKNPVILKSSVQTEDPESFQLWSSSDIGPSFIDGFGDGIWLEGSHGFQLINTTSFGILQATRTRISKTEYISCPSCGRTLFDLQETTAKIRSKTSHLKGLKIGIMGCIVNGPGEMADADYGYVGTGPGKIHLYKEQEVVRKNIPENDAVEALIDLIKENDDWIEPKIDE